MSRIGVIDLGTNTFHLLIADSRPGPAFDIIFKQRQFVKLGEEGVETIGTQPFARGLKAMEGFKKLLLRFQVEEVRAMGTAALRTASNGLHFIQEAERLTGIRIHLISGEEEARLIHLGVIQAIPFSSEKVLIMDIGGGSVEFIIADKEQVFWAKSFPIGVAVLYQQFHRKEPIAPEEIRALEDFLSEMLKPLSRALQEYPPSLLVGASGTFDVLENILVSEKEHLLHSSFPSQAFYPILETILRMNDTERYLMEEIPDTRVDLIVVALLLIRQVLDMYHPSDILVSSYAMKEGILADMIF